MTPEVEAAVERLEKRRQSWSLNTDSARVTVNLGDLRKVLSALSAEGGWRPITMQDMRLAVGEGPLKPADVLAGCNAELRRRQALQPQGKV